MFWFDSPTNRNTWNMTDTCPGDSTLNSKLWTSRSKGSWRKEKVQRSQKAPAALSEHRTVLLDRCVWAETVSPGVKMQFEKIWSCFSEQKLICFNFIKNLLILLLADQRPQTAHLLSNQAFNSKCLCFIQIRQNFYSMCLIMFRQPETTAQDCVSTFVSLKLLDMFNKTSFVPTEPDVLRCLNWTGA